MPDPFVVSLPNSFPGISSIPAEPTQRPASQTEAPATRETATDQGNQINNLAQHQQASFVDDPGIIARNGSMETHAAPPGEGGSFVADDPMNSLGTANLRSSVADEARLEGAREAALDNAQPNSHPVQRNEKGSTLERFASVWKAVVGALKVAGKYAGDISKLAGEGTRVATRSAVVAHGAGAVSGALAAGTAVLASANLALSAIDIRAGNKAGSQLAKIAEEAQSRAGALSAQDLGNAKMAMEAMAKGQGARQEAVLSGIELVKSGAQVTATALAVGGAGMAATLIAGPAVIVAALATEGTYQLVQAHKQEGVMNQKLDTLNKFATQGPEKIREQAAKLHEAAKELKTSRQQHLTNSKLLGGLKIGLGVAVAGLVMAAFTISAPVILPIVAIGVVSATVGVVITGAVQSARKKRSEAEINNAMKDAISSAGKLSAHEVYSRYGDEIGNSSRKDLGKVVKKAEMAVKVNEATAALSSMLDRLVDPSAGADPQDGERDQIIGYLTDDAFLKGPEKDLVKNMLQNLNPENFATSKGFLLETLTKSMI